MSDSTKLFLYVRKSTDEKGRQVYSIDHQLAELRELATRKQFHVVAELEERRSAMTQGRPVFNEMLTRIRKGEASGILSWHPDRLSRNSYDGHQITDLVEKGIVTSLEFAAYSFESSPQGILMLGIAFEMSKYYSANLSLRIKMAQRQRIREGHWPFRVPVGYLFDRNTRTVVVDPVRGPLIRKTFENYATGEYTLERLQMVMSAQGLTRRAFKKSGPAPMTRSYYHHFLQDPFYVGLLPHRGQLDDGHHEPLITTHLFDACQTILAQRGKYRTLAIKPFLYRGMFSCGECGCAITVERQKGHTYLRCTKSRGNCFQSYLRAEIMAGKIALSLRKISLQQNTIEAMLADLEGQQKLEAQRSVQEIKKIQSDMTTCSTKLQRLSDTYVEGTMPLESFNNTKRKLLMQKRSLAEKLTFVQTHRKTPLELVIRFIKGLTEARIVAEGDDEVQKRDLLQRAASNLKIQDGNVFWTPRGEWKHVAEIGRFARRASRTENALTSPCAKFPLKCGVSGAIRKPFQALSLVLKDQVGGV